MYTLRAEHTACGRGRFCCLAGCAEHDCARCRATAGERELFALELGVGCRPENIFAHFWICGAGRGARHVGAHVAKVRAVGPHELRYNVVAGLVDARGCRVRVCGARGAVRSRVCGAVEALFSARVALGRARRLGARAAAVYAGSVAAPGIFDVVAKQGRQRAGCGR